MRTPRLNALIPFDKLRRLCFSSSRVRAELKRTNGKHRKVML